MADVNQFTTKDAMFIRPKRRPKIRRYAPLRRRRKIKFTGAIKKVARISPKGKIIPFDTGEGRVLVERPREARVTITDRGLIRRMGRRKHRDRIRLIKDEIRRADSKGDVIRARLLKVVLDQAREKRSPQAQRPATTKAEFYARPRESTKLSADKGSLQEGADAMYGSRRRFRNMPRGALRDTFIDDFGGDRPVLIRRKPDGRYAKVYRSGMIIASDIGEMVEIFGFLKKIAKTVVKGVKKVAGFAKYFVPGLGQYWLIRDLKKKFTGDTKLMSSIESKCKREKGAKRKACIERMLKASKHAKGATKKYKGGIPKKSLKEQREEKKKRIEKETKEWLKTHKITGKQTIRKAAKPQTGEYVDYDVSDVIPEYVIVETGVGEEVVGIPIISGILSVVIGFITDLLYKKLGKGESLEEFTPEEMEELEREMEEQAKALAPELGAPTGIMGLLSKYWWIPAIGVGVYLITKGPSRPAYHPPPPVYHPPPRLPPPTS